jgi:hypothetical protein
MTHSKTGGGLADVVLLLPFRNSSEVNLKPILYMSVIIKQPPLTPFETLLANAQTTHDGFVDESATYTAPVPTMPDFQDDIDSLLAAIIGWGPEGARGSHADHLALLSAANVVRSDMRQLATYAMFTQPGNMDSWALLGFGFKSPKSPTAILPPVQDFRQFISRRIPEGFIKLKWERPLDTSAGLVKSYVLQHSSSGVQPQIDGGKGVVNVLAILTKTSIIVTPPYVGANYFWVTGINAAGYGVSSVPVLYNNPGKV